jgi:Cu+-exporting ATPase
MELKKAYFKVIGMYCTSCSHIIEKQLKKEYAIKKVDIDFMTNSLMVVYNSDLISIKQIKDKLENSGYKISSRYLA